MHAREFFLLFLREFWLFSTEFALCPGNGHAFFRPQLDQIGLKLEFPRFDGHFSLDEGECFSCRERGTRTLRISGNRWLRWYEPGAVLKALRRSPNELAKAVDDA